VHRVGLLYSISMTYFNITTSSIENYIYSADQSFLRVWHPKVHYRVGNSPPLRHPDSLPTQLIHSTSSDMICAFLQKDLEIFCLNCWMRLFPTSATHLLHFLLRDVNITISLFSCEEIKSWSSELHSFQPCSFYHLWIRRRTETKRWEIGKI
jgi:hypothetical protein